MAIRQRKACRVVIENSCSPGGNRVARRAGRTGSREPRRDVIRYRPANCRGADESCLVAPIAVRRIERVVVAHMAGGAGRWRWRHVRSGQRKPGNAVV